MHFYGASGALRVPRLPCEVSSASWSSQTSDSLEAQVHELGEAGLIACCRGESYLLPLAASMVLSEQRSTV